MVLARRLVTTAETTPLVVEGVNVTERVAEIEAQGYTIIPDFVQPNEIAQIRHAFDTSTQPLGKNSCRRLLVSRSPHSRSYRRRAGTPGSNQRDHFVQHSTR